MTTTKISILYDGACHLCSYEMTHYKKICDTSKIEFIDITKPDFSANYYNLNAMEVNRYLHVVDSSTKKVWRGIDAFVEIWKRLPGKRYSFLVNLFQINFVRFFATPSYHIFAIYLRPLLPKKNSCALE